MTTSTAMKNSPKADRARSKYSQWQMIIVSLIVIALLAIAIWTRLHDLGLPFDRDGYDEGVYWQSLRAMSAGHPLYQQIFDSQPPFFLLSIFPTYLLLGQTLWSARLGIVVISSLGLLGAFLLGKTLGGRIGAIAALLLLVADPLYLAQSQTIEAEAPSIALSLLGVGLAYLWWEHSEDLIGLCAIILSAVALALGILCKLFGVSALVPVGLLMLAQLWRISQQPSGTRLRRVSSLIAGCLAFVITGALVILPFVGAYHNLIQEVITFHLSAGTTLTASQNNNGSMLIAFFTSITAAAALYGAIIALLRRDWRVLPLLAWLLASVYLLWKQTPLFHRHLVILVPPLIALIIMGIGPVRWNKQLSMTFKTVTTLMTIGIVLLVAAVSFRQSYSYLSAEHVQSLADTTRSNLQVAQDLQAVTQPGQLVVTDAQFLAALAHRDTPPSLVDTSMVRITAGYLTTQQLMQESSRPQVHAVLFYTGRLRTQSLAAFYTWVTQHFRLVRDYGSGRQLWVKI
ncbi:MAG TPA: phospholipid carrier-dependent glycosyltransferase [Ktedonobacteraceae bacterium]|nr:phospholipid carrier-dependent glycosyltransferase [Ktedonobacteraceae bacterium]